MVGGAWWLVLLPGRWLDEAKGDMRDTGHGVPSAHPREHWPPGSSAFECFEYIVMNKSVFNATLA